MLKIKRWMKMSEDPEFKGGNSKYYIIGAIAVIAVLAATLGWLAVKEGYISVTGASTSDPGGELVTGTVSGIEIGALEASSGSKARNASSSASAYTTGSKGYSDDSSLPKNPTVSIKASVDSVPSVKSPTRIEDLEIRFSNLNTNIKVNKEQLELTALDKVTLKLHSFAGNINLNERTLSLNGRISKIDVNGVVLSSEELEISFEGLDYDAISAQGMELAGIELSNGAGDFKLEQGKVSYVIENKDRVSLSSFFGDLTVDEAASSSLLSIDGAAKGVTTIGTVNLILQ